MTLANEVAEDLLRELVSPAALAPAARGLVAICSAATGKPADQLSACDLIGVVRDAERGQVRHYLAGARRIETGHRGTDYIARCPYADAARMLIDRAYADRTAAALTRGLATCRSRMIRAVLGHAGFKTAERHYIHAGTIEVARDHGALIQALKRRR